MSIEGRGGEIEGESVLMENIMEDTVSRASTSGGGSSNFQSVPLPSTTTSPSSPHPFAQSLSTSLTLLLRSLTLALPHLLSTTLPGLQSSLHLLPPFGPSSPHKSRSPFTTNAFRGGSYGGGNSSFPSNLFSGPPSTGPIWPWAPGGSRAHRKVTDLLLAVNAAAFLLQILSNNRLLLLGAKVNSLIHQGQYYRLFSSALLHADLQHLVVNSLSLNTIGPDAESLLGGRRMAGIYVASALASSALSLVLNPSPSVGASGAIFGLVGALGVFFLRHKKQLSLRGSAYLRGLGSTVMLNLVLGVLWRNIDNSGHLGGLLGGAAAAWLVGPRIISAGFPPKLYDYPPIAELVATVSTLAFAIILQSSEAADDGPRNGSGMYGKVLEPTLDTVHMEDLPGFTRSAVARDHALITPESRVFSPLPGWENTLSAHLVTPAIGAHFAMSLLRLSGNASSAPPVAGVERFVFVVSGQVSFIQYGTPGETNKGGAANECPTAGDAGSASTCTSSIVRQEDLAADSYVYLPPNIPHSLASASGATLVLIERRYCPISGLATATEVESGSEGLAVVLGQTHKQPILPVPGEVFALRKLLPTTTPYDFNIHIMDFEPGEFLNVKEVHYNQHGLLLLEGRGIYRLADSWYPVQAGDAIWMAPFVPQWYAALGKSRSRYLLYKDVNRDPLTHPSC
ncbi:unnamed protein product [Closterium sp. Yama58-4]|nr:unnamed protein product [Closterium sp. Yama58-4]